MRKQIPVIIIVLLSAVIAYFIFSPNNASQSAVQITPPPPQTKTNTQPTGVDAIIAYAAIQFNVTKEQIAIVSTEKQDWDTICLGMDIPDYDCTQQAISGYEVTMEINGTTMSYRGSEDGTIIRFVKE